jgi:glycosyltransferase involved in cell wall biosynthesis
MKINWIDIANDSFIDGYGESSKSLHKHLGTKFDIVHNSSNKITNFPNFPKGLVNIETSSRTSGCSVYIHNTTGNLYQIEDGYNVGFTYWETNRLPKAWIQPMNSCDEIWTTSSWAKEVFLTSGIRKPVYDFKLGVDGDLYAPPAQPREVKRSYFTFMSIGSPSTRKNSQMAVDAFLKLFGNSDGYRLLYKSNGPPDARDFSLNQRRPLRDNHKIQLIDYQMDKSSLASLYEHVDCVLYPTSGEGWGFLPIQGIAKGIPTICTNFSACTEYAHLSVPLSYKLGKDKMYGVYEGCGEWATPNFDDLCDKMLHVVNNYKEVSEKTFAGAQWIAKNLTWDSVYPAYEERLCQILKNTKIKV